MIIINTSPTIYQNNSNTESLSSDELYILIYITSLLFICYTITYCRNISTENNEIRLSISTIDNSDNSDNNKIVTNLDNSNLSDDDDLPSYNEAVKDY